MVAHKQFIKTCIVKGLSEEERNFFVNQLQLESGHEGEVFIIISSPTTTVTPLEAMRNHPQNAAVQKKKKSGVYPENILPNRRSVSLVFHPPSMHMQFPSNKINRYFLAIIDKGWPGERVIPTASLGSWLCHLQIEA